MTSAVFAYLSYKINKMNKVHVYDDIIVILEKHKTAKSYSKYIAGIDEL